MKFTTLKRWSKTVSGKAGGATIDSTGCNFHRCFADKAHPSWMLLLLFLVQSVNKPTNNRDFSVKIQYLPSYLLLFTHKDPIVAGISSTWLSHFSLTQRFGAASWGIKRGWSQKCFPCFKCLRHWFSSPVVDFNCIMSKSSWSWTGQKQVTSCASLGAHEYVHLEKEKQTAIVRISRTTFGFAFQMLWVQSHRIHVWYIYLHVVGLLWFSCR